MEGERFGALNTRTHVPMLGVLGNHVEGVLGCAVCCAVLAMCCAWITAVLRCAVLRCAALHCATATVLCCWTGRGRRAAAAAARCWTGYSASPGGEKESTLTTFAPPSERSNLEWVLGKVRALGGAARELPPGAARSRLDGLRVAWERLALRRLRRTAETLGGCRWWKQRLRGRLVWAGARRR